MQTELEAKFLDINHSQIRQKLKDQGATLIRPQTLMTRSNYDFPDKRLEQVNGWVRVRDEGDKVTLSYKQSDDRSLHGTKEINLVVNDYKNTREFLTAITLKEKNYQETKRESWLLDDVQVELDEWPWVKSFIELEAMDEVKLKSVAQKLDLDWNRAVHGSVAIVYQAEYDVPEAEVNYWEEIKFGPVPGWLEKRRKK